MQVIPECNLAIKIWAFRAQFQPDILRWSHPPHWSVVNQRNRFEASMQLVQILMTPSLPVHKHSFNLQRWLIYACSWATALCISLERQLNIYISSGNRNLTTDQSNISRHQFSPITTRGPRTFIIRACNFPAYRPVLCRTGRTRYAARKTYTELRVRRINRKKEIWL